MVQASAKIFSGPEPSLLAEAVRACVEELVGTQDRSLVLEELSGEEYAIEQVVDAVQTPPLLSDRRVVVVREFNRFKVDQLKPLIELLSDLPSTTDLVIEWGSGAVPKKLVEAAKAIDGEQIKVGAPGTGRARSGWFQERFDTSLVQLDPSAQQLIEEHLGEDVARLTGLLQILEGAYGVEAKLGAAEVGPFLGDEGAVPPWDLTDALDRGEMKTALEVVQRMMAAGGRHPLQIMAILHTHYERILRLDGTQISNEKDAAAHLEMKGSTFPAKKALSQMRRLGPDKTRRAIELLSKTDMDLRGKSALDGDILMEILVARLAQLSH
ncbi:MAG: DNA polymerase III subunit delta [Acidimicrobiaceae bacterium]|nr:DNA polymerase III subunit delta [Acidimicrobiaceae bacterium]